MDATTQQADQRPPQSQPLPQPQSQPQPQLGLQLPIPPPPAHEHTPKVTPSSSQLSLGDHPSIPTIPIPPPQAGLAGTTQQQQEQEPPRQQQQQQQQQQPGGPLQVPQQVLPQSQLLFHQQMQQQQQGAAAMRNSGQQTSGSGGNGGSSAGVAGASSEGQQQQQQQQQAQNNLLSQAVSPQQQQQLMSMYMAMAQNPAAMMLMPYMAQYPMYSRMALPTDQVTEDAPTYVNAKQYRRIIKRREARAKLEARRKVAPQRKSFLHKSRHDHACRRVRGPGGRFLTKAELAEYRKQLEAQDPEGATAPVEEGPDRSKAQARPPAPRKLGAIAAAPVAAAAAASSAAPGTASKPTAVMTPLNFAKDPATMAAAAAGFGGMQFMMPSTTEGVGSAAVASAGHAASTQPSTETNANG